MIKFIKSLFAPTPIDFKLKIVESLAMDYYFFHYSINGGKTWRLICHADKPFSDDYDWEWKRLGLVSYNIDSNTFKHELDMFSTYEKVQAYHKAEKEKFELNDRLHREKRAKVNKHKAEVLNTINK